MMYLFDSDTCINYMRKGKKAELIDAKLLQHEKVEKNLRETMDFIANFEVIPFDKPEADAYGMILDSLECKGQVIGNNDIMIAATALIRNAVLVTSNTREFSRIDGLKLDDWTL